MRQDFKCQTDSCVSTEDAPASLAQDITAYGKPPQRGTNRRILQAAGAVAISSIVVKAAAMVKEQVVAARFGRSDEMDAFLIAFLIPGLLVNLFSESMNQALIPTFVRVRSQQGRIKAQSLLSSSMLATCLLLGAASLTMAATARILLPRMLIHFSSDKINLTNSLFYGLVPIILLGGVNSNCSAILNTFERFAWPALAQMVIPVAVILTACWTSARFGVWSLVYGNLAGSAVLAVLMISMLHAHGYRFDLRWSGFDHDIRDVARQYGAVMLSGLVASGGLLVDQGMAATLPPGSVATLTYANRIVGVVLTLMAGAVATAITPYLAEMVANREWTRCRHTVNTWLGLTAIVSMPLAVFLMLESHWLVQIVFQHGSFGSQDTASVSRVQTMYAFQLPFFVVSRVFYRYLLALQKANLILACGVINLILDIILNILCMRWLGVAGIALATSLWSVSTFFFLGYWTYKLLHRSQLSPSTEMIA